MTLETLKDLYIEQLRDIYSAETQLLDALPKMAEAASNAKLKKAFKDHLKETEIQRDRLVKIFNGLKASPEGHTCKGMQGLIEEGQDMIEEDANEDVRDAGLITAAQRVEHYEIAAYGTVSAYADLLDRHDERRMLEESLEEEGDADELLNDIAIEVVNPKAMA